jgi:cell division inhibitor SulA
MQALVKADLHQSPAPEVSVTELILTRHSPDQAMVLLPMMSHLSKNSSRWVTWISPHKIDRSILDSYGVDTSKVRIIYANEGQDSRWLIWEALQAGTSECVIATPGSLTEGEMEHLRQAANKGQSHGLLIHYR